MGGHEIYRFGRHFFGSHHQVAFVLAVGIVRYNDNAALGNVAYDIVNGIEVKSLLRFGDHLSNTITSVAALRQAGAGEG